MKASVSSVPQNRTHKKTRTKQLTSSSNNLSQKYIQLSKEKPCFQTPKKPSTPSSKDLISYRTGPPKTGYSNCRRATSPYTSKAQKININMEIRNFNIYNGQTSTTALEQPKKKKLHKKTISALNSPSQLNAQSKNPFKENGKNQKKIKHCKAKSQQNLKTNPKQWGDLLSKLAKNPKDHDEDVVTKYALCNRCGFCPEKKKKTNQDTYIVIQNFMKKNRYMFGVCDGHGVNGHYVSEFIKQILPENIQYFFLKNKSMHKPVKVSVEASIKQAFHKTSKDLLESGIDTMFSGTTTCIVYIDRNQLYCANLGDSRAVLFSKLNSGSEGLDEWEYTDLSTDHKAEDKREAIRIEMNGGRVFPYRDEEGQQMGPIRVWVKEQNIPGLAMTRSFGDYVASTVGVIDEPEILHHTIIKQNKFMVIASDGLWQFITHEQVARIMTASYIRNDPESGVKDLEKAAVDAWMREDESIDDITIVVVFFKYY